MQFCSPWPDKQNQRLMWPKWLLLMLLTFFHSGVQLGDLDHQKINSLLQRIHPHVETIGFIKKLPEYVFSMSAWNTMKQKRWPVPGKINWGAFQVVKGKQICLRTRGRSNSNKTSAGVFSTTQHTVLFISRKCFYSIFQFNSTRSPHTINTTPFPSWEYGAEVSLP